MTERARDFAAIGWGLLLALDGFALGIARSTLTRCVATVAVGICLAGIRSFIAYVYNVGCLDGVLRAKDMLNEMYVELEARRRHAPDN